VVRQMDLVAAAGADAAEGEVVILETLGTTPPALLDIPRLVNSMVMRHQLLAHPYKALKMPTATPGVMGCRSLLVAKNPVNRCVEGHRYLRLKQAKTNLGET
jgi:hypothetical protein